MQRKNIAGFLSRIDECAQRSGFALYVVGGFVRDLLRGAAADDRDIDLLVDGNALEFAPVLQRMSGGDLKLFPDFFTAKITLPADSALAEVDFASARTEIYEQPGALPRVALAPLADDLKRRDFSVNAVALPLAMLIRFFASSASNSEIRAACIDPHGGRDDIEGRIIRVLHARSFVDDPTRLFRALRYKARLNARFDPDSERLFSQAIENNALRTISFRRIFNELIKIFEEDGADQCVSDAHRRGVLAAVTDAVPQLNREKLVARLLQLAGHAALPAVRGDVFSVLTFVFAASLAAGDRAPLFNQLSLPKKMRAVCEEDLSAIASKDAAHAYSAAGRMIYALDHNLGAEWIAGRSSP